jgi:hypothetical protein
MSAYVVSTKHIDGILSLALSTGGADKCEGYFYEGSWHPITLQTCNSIGSMLLFENEFSVAWPNVGSVPAAIYYKYVAPRIYPTVIQVLKLISSLDYQSCEHPTWKESEAYACLSYLKDWLITQLPGYDEAAWSL